VAGADLLCVFVADIEERLKAKQEALYEKEYGAVSFKRSLVPAFPACADLTPVSFLVRHAALSALQHARRQALLRHHPAGSTNLP
jgi:hypothetical protein